MRRLIFASLWLLVGACACAQSSPQQPESGATVEIVNPNHVYNGTTQSLRQLDFRNFRFHVFDERGESILAAKLRNGKYDSKEHDRKWKMGDGYDWLRLDWVRLVGEESQFAIASLSWVTAGGSTSDFGIVQVFILREGHPVVVQQILFNMRGCVANANSELTSRPLLLTIKGVHGWEHCCPKTLDVVTFSWAGSSFKRKSYHSLPLPETC